MARRKKAEQTGDVRPNNELTEDEKRCLTYSHKAQWQAAQKIVDEAIVKRKAIEATAKSELGKGAVADIKELILLEQPKGEEALKADMNRKLRLARWANSSVGTQFRFDDFDGTPADDVARERGKTAGLKGDPRKPPYDPSTSQYRAWMTGYDEGQAIALSDFRDKLKPFPEKPAADPKQMDLKDRKDVNGDADMVMADLPSPSVADPPFAIPDAPGVPQ